MSESFIGQISLFANNYAPRSWAYCDGQLIAISQNNALFSILGTIYGGDGRTTFALPDLQGRVALHAGRGPGLTDRRLGQKGGGNSVTLTTTQMPSHSHQATLESGSSAMPATTVPGTTTVPGGNIPATADIEVRGGGQTTGNIYAPAAAADSNLSPAAVSGTVTIAHDGGSQAHNNMQPFIGISYVICMFGIYPSRN